MEHLISSILKHSKLVSIEVNEEEYNRLKEITDIKQVFIKDIISKLISIYNEQAITDKNFQQRKQEEESRLKNKIKDLATLNSPK